MTRGGLGQDHDPRLPIILHGSRRSTIEAVVDTGFSEYLCLARRHRNRMRLNYVGEECFELADGSEVQEPVYQGEVTFDGVRQPVLVTITRSDDTLIGTALLRDKRLTINFRDGDVIVDDP